MKLNEKFNKAKDAWIVEDKCEEIADDYAIEFAKWVQFHSELWIKYRTSELLKIFKEEKRL